MGCHDHVDLYNFSLSFAKRDKSRFEFVKTLFITPLQFYTLFCSRMFILHFAATGNRALKNKKTNYNCDICL